MTSHPFDPQDVLRILETSLSRDSAHQPQLKNPVEGISVFTHACLLSAGFRLVGISDDDNLETPIEASKPRPLPASWNASNGSYAFRYAHSQSAMQFIIRINRMGDKTAFMGLGMGDNRTATFDITTKDYMSDSFFPYSLPSSSDIASPGANKLVDGFISEHRLTDLGNLIKINIIQKLMPGLMKSGSEEGQSRSDNVQQREEQQRDRGQDHRPRPEDFDPLRLPRPGEGPYGVGAHGPRPIPEGLRPPGFEDEYEILQPPRGYGQMPGGGNPLSIGADDLNPPGLGPNPPLRGPFFGEGGAGGMGPMGGMHPGPDHPMFGGGGNVPNPRAPPGARYDPTFPGDYPPTGGLRGPRGPGGGMGGGMGGGPPNPFSGFGGGDFI